MFVRRLEHVNIRTRFFDETVRFYTELLGLRVGPRRGTRPGAWLYDPGGEAVIHLSPADPNDPEQIVHLNEYLGTRDVDSPFARLIHTGDDRIDTRDAIVINAGAFTTRRSPYTMRCAPIAA